MRAMMTGRGNLAGAVALSRISASIARPPTTGGPSAKGCASGVAAATTPPRETSPASPLNVSVTNLSC